MQAYQADIAKLETNGSIVMGISVDPVAANAKFAKDSGLTFSLLSDATQQVSKDYGVLNPLLPFANRTTFVVDRDGVIQRVDAGGGAVDPTGAVQFCSRLSHK
jgi:peroxiredoxin Q/BCP